MNIVYATDDKGALGTGVSIVSLMEIYQPTFMPIFTS